MLLPIPGQGAVVRPGWNRKFNHLDLLVRATGASVRNRCAMILMRSSYNLTTLLYDVVPLTHNLRRISPGHSARKEAGRRKPEGHAHSTHPRKSNGNRKCDRQSNERGCYLKSLEPSIQSPSNGLIRPCQYRNSSRVSQRRRANSLDCEHPSGIATSGRFEFAFAFDPMTIRDLALFKSYGRKWCMG